MLELIKLVYGIKKISSSHGNTGEEYMNRVKYVLLSFFLIVSIPAISGGNNNNLNNNGKYFFGIGVGDGGGLYGGTFNAIRISYQNHIKTNDEYGFDYLSEISANYWKDDSRLNSAESIDTTSDQDSSNITITYSRILRKYLNNNIFTDIGFGLALHSENSIGGADLGEKINIESRVGLGYERNTYRSLLTYYHYSNGGIAHQNDGVDIFMLSISKYF